MWILLVDAADSLVEGKKLQRLNRYVFDNQNELVNLTTKKSLPKDSSEEELRKNFFLEGQEKEGVDYALFGKPPSKFEIKIIPTWECNLRCTHCFVLHELVKKDNRQIDKEKFFLFLRSYLEKYPSIEEGRFQFIGGEAALRAKFNLELISEARQICEEFGVKARFATTTNCFELSEEIIEFYSNMDDFTVSLDGTKHFHDNQRKALDSSESPYEKTMSNLGRLVELGMRDSIMIQASMVDEAINEEVIFSFYKELLMLGIKFEKIRFGSIVPTEHHPNKGKKFLESCQSGVFPVPCCKYRFMHDFVVDSTNKIYCDYFDAEQKNYLGELSDSIEKIEEMHVKKIREQMEVLHDEKCKQCPVIGICWGWCCNTNKTMKPSEHCDQAGLYSRALANAEKGNLVGFYRDHRKNDMTCQLPKG